MKKFYSNKLQSYRNILSSHIYHTYHEWSIRWSDFLWYEKMEKEVLDKDVGTLSWLNIPSFQVDNKIDILQLKTDITAPIKQPEVVPQDNITKTSELFKNTKFATKINTALQQLGSNETAESFMDKIDKLFVDLMSREFAFLPDNVRNTLWSSVWSALLSWLYSGSSEQDKDKHKQTWPTKTQAIWSIFNSLTWVDFTKLQTAWWWFDLIKQVLSTIWWFDLLKKQITKISYILDMVIILKKEDREKNLQLDRSKSIINDPSKFVSILNTNDQATLSSIKNDQDTNKITWLFFDQPQGVNMKDIWDKLWNILDGNAAKAMVQGMQTLHNTWTKLMNNRDSNQTRFKWYYDIWKKILSQVEWLATAFGIDKEETSWLRSVLNRVFMIFTGKRFDSYEEEELTAKYKIDDSLKTNLDKAKTDYLTNLAVSTAVPLNPLDNNIVWLRGQDKQDMIRWIDKDKLTKSLTTNLTSIDEKLTTELLWDKKTWDVKQDIWLLINSSDLWKNIAEDQQISDHIKDAGWVVYALWVLLTKGNGYLEAIRSWYVHIPYVKTQVTTPEISKQGTANPDDKWQGIDSNSESTEKPIADISSIENKKIDQLSSSERKLLFQTVFGYGPATDFLTLVDNDYWWNSWNIYLNILALAKHEWAQKTDGNWKFGPDRVNDDSNGQTAMGTFQISAKWWNKGVEKKYTDLVNKWIRYISTKNIWVNYDLSKYSYAQQDLLAFIWHTNWYTKKWWIEANWRELSSKLFDNARDAKFMSDIQVGISKIGQNVAYQIQNNKVDDYV